MEIGWFDGSHTEVIEMPTPPTAVVDPINGPAPYYNFPNSSGLVYQAEHMHRCRQQVGVTESEKWNLTQSLELMETLDTIRNQCGIKYAADEEH
jgi:hypothetical protein